MAVVAALTVLVVGDFGSTFFYHVPQHLWFTLHLRTHHDRRRSYWDHAVLSPDPAVVLDGLLGAVPYLGVAAVMSRFSWQGAVAGLVLGQVHVWWRHTTDIGWRTPASLRAVARALWIVLPEDHDGHHRNPAVEYGDIFRFYDAPARVLLAKLAPTSRRTRNAALRRPRASRCEFDGVVTLLTKRALFLISDTGGGHRSAANAITAALAEIREPVFEHRIDDVAAHCSFPLTQLGWGYSAALRYAPPVYGALYYATNGRRRYKALVRFCEPLYRERLRDLFVSYRPDVIVSVHPLLNHAALRARADAKMHRVPIITVITDLGKVHESWLTPEADAVVVPAREVYERAISRGVSPARLRMLGQPIHPNFDDVVGSKEELRAQLGLPHGTFVTLLMAGGEGGGKLLPTTLALAKARLPMHLVVVCGRNETMRVKMQDIAPSFHAPMTVLGFTDKVPELMRAADLLVTKAGPGTLAEANAAQLPVVVYDYVPGQERGNVDFVRSNGIGDVAINSTSEVVRAVERLVMNPKRLAAMRLAQEIVAPKRSSRRIAALIAQMASAHTIPIDDEYIPLLHVV